MAQVLGGTHKVAAVFGALMSEQESPRPREFNLAGRLVRHGVGLRPAGARGTPLRTHPSGTCMWPTGRVALLTVLISLTTFTGARCPVCCCVQANASHSDYTSEIDFLSLKAGKKVGRKGEKEGGRKEGRKRAKENKLVVL